MLFHQQHFELTKLSEFEAFQTALGFIKESRIYWKKSMYKRIRTVQTYAVQGSTVAHYRPIAMNHITYIHHAM